MADSLEDLLDFCEKAMMEDGTGKLDDTEMTWTLLLVFFAGSALVVAIDRAEMRIVRTFLTRS